MTSPYNGNGCGYDGCGYGIGVPMSSTAVPLLLDDLAATYGAWSVGRKLRSGFGTYGLLMRRSTDNDVTECTFDSDGLSDVGLVEDFSSGGDVFIDTLLNQDANGSTLDLIQPTTGNQPRICNSGTAVTENGVLAAETSTNRKLYVASSTGLFNFLHDGTSATVSAVAKFAAAGGDTQFLVTSQGWLSLPIGFTMYAGGSLGAIVGNGSAWSALAITGAIPTALLTWTQFIDANNGTAANREQRWISNSAGGGNNTQTASPSASSANTNLTFGGPANNTLYGLRGRIAELIIWPTDERADRAIWEADQASVYGITLA